MGKNREIRVIEMNENQNVQDGVWVEVAQTDSLELQ